MSLCYHLPSLTCNNCRAVTRPLPLAPLTWPRNMGLRRYLDSCGVCGSTAIDHTELGCRENVENKKPRIV